MLRHPELFLAGEWYDFAGLGLVLFGGPLVAWRRAGQHIGLGRGRKGSDTEVRGEFLAGLNAETYWVFFSRLKRGQTTTHSTTGLI